MIAGLGFSLLAGVLSTLSPCVLPLVPIVLGAAASEHRLGPIALAAGLAISFTAIGLFVATVGFSVGLDGDFFRSIAAVLMLMIGVVLVVPAFHARFSMILGPVGQWAEESYGGFAPAGLSGQFGVGLLLGAVWSPCVGPTLGAASVVAAQGRDLTQVVLTMVIFGIGAALPLLIIGALSRHTLAQRRGSLLNAGGLMSIALGMILALTGVAILGGFDKTIETALVNASPDWLTELTTRF